MNDAIAAAWLCKRPDPHIAYLAPTYTQAKDIAWNYLRKFTAGTPGITYNETELRLDLPNGGRLRLYGADNYDRMRGLYLDGIILDEFALMDPRAWSEVVRPALSDRQGWATFIGTPRGHNSFWTIWNNAQNDPDWYTLELKASQTGILPAEELADARKTMTADEYEQEYECSFEAAIKGAYYAVEMKRLTEEKRITHVPYDRYTPVMTSWDLGFTDSTAIWFVQACGNEIHLIDYYENNSQPLSHYADVLNAKGKAWGEGFRWGEHYFPHDIQVQELTIGRSRVQTMRELGIEPIIVPMHAVNDGINATRRIFDRFWIDGAKCERGIECLRLYCRDYDGNTQMLRDKPKKSEWNHGADSLRYFSSGWYGNSARPDVKNIDRHRKAFYGQDKTSSWKVA